MFEQPLTWKAFVLQLLLSLGPALFLLIGTLVTLWHQRKLKAAELSASSTLKARELMFGIYEKRLSTLLQRSATLGATAAKLQVTLEATDDRDKFAEAATGFFSVVYDQMLQMPDDFREIHEDLSGAGLTEKCAYSINFIKENIMDHPPQVDPTNMFASILLMLKVTAHMISLQKILIETKAKELFQDYLPSSIQKG